MELVEVNVVGAQPAQARLDLGHDVIAAVAPVVGAVVHLSPDFGRQHHPIAVPGHCLPQQLLAAPETVGVGCVEEVDAHVEGRADQPLRLVGVEQGAKVGAAQTEPRHFDPGRSQIHILHAHVSSERMLDGLVLDRDLPTLSLKGLEFTARTPLPWREGAGG